MTPGGPGIGRKFKIRLRHNRFARETALATIRPTSDRKRWIARIGGPDRGWEQTFLSREQAIKAIHEHYDGAMMRYVKGLIG